MGGDRNSDRAQCPHHRTGQVVLSGTQGCGDLKTARQLVDSKSEDYDVLAKARRNPSTAMSGCATNRTWKALPSRNGGIGAPAGRQDGDPVCLFLALKLAGSIEGVRACWFEGDGIRFVTLISSAGRIRKEMKRWKAERRSNSSADHANGI